MASPYPPQVDPVADPQLARFLARLEGATTEQRRAIAARLWSPARGESMEPAMAAMRPILDEMIWRELRSRFGPIRGRWSDTGGDRQQGWVDAPAWYAPILDADVGVGHKFREATLGHAFVAAAAIGVRDRVGEATVRVLLAPFAALQLDDATPPAPTTVAAESPATTRIATAHGRAADRALAGRLVAHLATERVVFWDDPQLAFMRLMRQQGEEVLGAIAVLQRTVVAQGVTTQADRLAMDAVQAIVRHEWKEWPAVLRELAPMPFPGTSVPMPIVLEAMVAVQACLVRAALPPSTFDTCIAPFAAWYAREERTGGAT